MVHAEEDIKRLNQRTLRITSSTVAMPFSLSIAKVIIDTVWEAGSSHVLTPRKERTQLMEEDLW